jgi:hypothetical protein
MTREGIYRVSTKILEELSSKNCLIEQEFSIVNLKDAVGNSALCDGYLITRFLSFLICIMQGKAYRLTLYSKLK